MSVKNVSIPGPCHQSWQQMAPVSGGRHCESCCKTVVDFLGMTNAQLISYLTTHGNVCGRLSTLQLDRVNLQLNGQDAKPQTSWKKWVMTTALLTSTIFYKAAGQTTPVTPEVEQSQPGNYHAAATEEKVVAVKQSGKVIKGRIVDEACMPLNGATVRVVGTNIALATDTNGRFKFHAPISAKQFTVSFVGFETETVAIDSLQNGVQDLKLTPQVVSINNVVVIKSGHYYQRRTELVGAIAVVTGVKTTKKHCWLWRMYYKYIRTPIHNMFIDF
ncbi:MAG: carboxypeptidase-like regulatory domain-containing protein [Mucilaginibacter sp.]